MKNLIPDPGKYMDFKTHYFTLQSIHEREEIVKAALKEGDGIRLTLLKVWDEFEGFYNDRQVIKDTLQKQFKKVWINNPAGVYSYAKINKLIPNVRYWFFIMRSHWLDVSNSWNKLKWHEKRYNDACRKELVIKKILERYAVNDEEAGFITNVINEGYPPLFRQTDLHYELYMEKQPDGKTVLINNLSLLWDYVSDAKADVTKKLAKLKSWYISWRSLCLLTQYGDLLILIMPPELNAILNLCTTWDENAAHPSKEEYNKFIQGGWDPDDVERLEVRVSWEHTQADNNNYIEANKLSNDIRKQLEWIYTGGR